MLEKSKNRAITSAWISHILLILTFTADIDTPQFLHQVTSAITKVRSYGYILICNVLDPKQDQEENFLSGPTKSVEFTTILGVECR